MAHHSGLDRVCIHRQKVLTLGPGRWERRRGRRRGCMRRRAGGRQTLDFDPKGMQGVEGRRRAAGGGARAARCGFILDPLTKQRAGRGPKARRSPPRTCSTASASTLPAALPSCPTLRPLAHTRPTLIARAVSRSPLSRPLSPPAAHCATRRAGSRHPPEEEFVHRPPFERPPGPQRRSPGRSPYVPACQPASRLVATRSIRSGIPSP